MERQRRRLDDLVAHARTHSPYYRDHVRQVPERVTDITTLPVTSKPDLMGDFDGVELITAPTAEIGIELARARQPRVVIMDINLPGMSGLEATKILSEWPETHHIPVIALSAAATARDAARAAEVGFHRYLTKPVEVDKLTAALEELLS